jgi:hypothetical protein
MQRTATGKSQLTRIVATMTGLVFVCMVATAAVSLIFQLESLTISSHSIAADGVTVATAAFNKGANAVMPVALTSSSPAVATVPSSVPVIPPNDRVTFPVRGVSPGCTAIIAAYKGRSREQKIVVHPTNSLAAFSFTVSDQPVILGGQAPAKVANAGIGMPSVSLTSSNPRVASVPPSVELARGSVAFSISGLREGCAIISATIRGQTVRKTVRVVDIGG